MYARKSSLVLLSAGLLFTGAAFAAPPSDVTICAGTWSQRDSGEFLVTSYNLRNVNPSGDITIERIRIWDHDGAEIYDSLVDGMPIEPSFSNPIGPRQSSSFTAASLGLPPAGAVKALNQVEIVSRTDNNRMRRLTALLSVTELLSLAVGSDRDLSVAGACIDL